MFLVSLSARAILYILLDSTNEIRHCGIITIMTFNKSLGVGNMQYSLNGNLEVPTGERKFDFGGVSTHDLRIRSSDALPIELRVQ